MNAVTIPEALAGLQPMGDFVLVQRLPEDGQKQGLILLPQNRQDARLGPYRGTVLKVGPGDKLKNGTRAPMNVKPGDLVLYDRVPANVVMVAGVEYTLCHEEQHIIAALEG